MSALNWGDVPTWLAMVAAGIAGALAAGVYRIEQRRDRELQAAQERSQAGQISSWPTADVQHAGLRNLVSVAITTVNLSQQPVYEVHLRVEAPRMTLFDIRLPVLPPQQADRTSLPDAMIVAALEGYEPGTPNADATAAEASERAARNTRVDLTFRDVEGIVWQRSADGVLQRKAR